MTEIIGVRFKNGGKEYYFNPNGMQFAPGDNVIIETARGVEFGECTQANTMVDEMTLVSPLRPVLRAATPEDAKTVELNKKKEAKAFDICQKKIDEHKLDMKLVDVEYNFEGSKILFFFTSDGRVDFRELVKDLASVFHTRIELRQIGVRDEAKMLGGLGICGRPFCCHQFLEDFQPVSIKMAKTQNLSLNPTKISGTCGRLMCCLKYEQDAYEDALKRCPKNDSLVETPAGIGVVCQVNLLRETVKVRLDETPEAPQVFPCDQIKVIRSGKGKRPEGYELPEPQERTQTLRKSAPPTPKAELRLAPLVEKPEGEAADDPAAEEEKKARRSRNRDRDRRRPRPEGETPAAPVEQEVKVKKAPKEHKEGKPAQAKKQEGKAPQSQKKPRPQAQSKSPEAKSGEGQQAAAPQGEKKVHSSHRGHRNHHRRPNKPKAEG